MATTVRINEDVKQQLKIFLKSPTLIICFEYPHPENKLHFRPEECQTLNK